MGYLSPFCLILVFLISFSCGSTGKKEAHTNYHDSLSQSVTAQDTMPKIQPPLPGPAPNTALLKSKILTLTLSESGPTVITLAVIEVIARGASTPVITQNDTLRVKAASLPESIREGSEFTGLFIHRPVLNKFKDTSMAWQLTKIEQKDYK